MRPYRGRWWLGPAALALASLAGAQATKSTSAAGGRFIKVGNAASPLAGVTGLSGLQNKTSASAKQATNGGPAKVTAKISLISQSLADWMKQSVAGGPSAQTIELLVTDMNDRVKQSYTLTDAQIDRVVLPTFDVGAREPGEITIEVSSPSERLTWSQSQVVAVPHAGARAIRKADFRFDLPGGLTQHVGQVAAITLRPGGECDQVRIKVDGQAGLDAAKSAKTGQVKGPATLTFLGTNKRDVLGTVTFGELMVTQVTTPMNARGNGVTATVTLACSRAALEITKLGTIQ